MRTVVLPKCCLALSRGLTIKKWIGILSIAAVGLIGPIASATRAGADQLMASIDGKPFTAQWTESSQFMLAGTKMLNFNGHIGTGIGSRLINCQMASPQPGSFPIGGGAWPARTSCSYTSGANLMTDKYRFKSGSITITKLDAGASEVSGTFSGSAANAADQSLAITNGSFDIHYTGK